MLQQIGTGMATKQLRDPHWFLAVTNPRCERRAQLDLIAKGYRTFMPTSRHWVRHARVVKAVDRPILSRYLFVEVDYPRQSFGLVRLCNGVESILTVDGEPAVIADKYVEDLLVRQLQGEWDYVTADPVRYIDARGNPQTRLNGPMPVGARIRIMEGEFADMLATVTRIKGKRVEVRMVDSARRSNEMAWNVRAA